MVNEKSVLHSETICGCNEPQQTKIICYNNKITERSGGKKNTHAQTHTGTLHQLDRHTIAATNTNRAKHTKFYGDFITILCSRKTDAEQENQ